MCWSLARRVGRLGTDPAFPAASPAVLGDMNFESVILPEDDEIRPEQLKFPFSRWNILLRRYASLRTEAEILGKAYANKTAMMRRAKRALMLFLD